MVGILAKLRNALKKTSNDIASGIDRIFSIKRVDENSLHELEELLIIADVGPVTSKNIINALSKKKLNKEVEISEVKELLAEIIDDILKKCNHEFILDESKLNVVLVYGVNGNGKTTTIGKLIAKYSEEGKKVAVAACDTFRAAAVDQLREWCNRTNVKFYFGDFKSDPASVAYKAVTSAIQNQIDVLFIDTAGRLSNKTNLMAELEKINRVIKKIDQTIKHHKILILDGTTGQNAITQVTEFQKIVPISGLIITKLDGTSKGGAIINIIDQCQLPVYFLGIGEKISDIKEFDTIDFSKSLLECDK